MVNKIYFKRSACCTVLCVLVKVVKSCASFVVDVKMDALTGGSNQRSFGLERSSAVTNQWGEFKRSRWGATATELFCWSFKSKWVCMSHCRGYFSFWFLICSIRKIRAVGITEKELHLYFPKKLILENPLFFENSPCFYFIQAIIRQQAQTEIKTFIPVENLNISHCSKLMIVKKS